MDLNLCKKDAVPSELQNCSINRPIKNITRPDKIKDFSLFKN